MTATNQNFDLRAGDDSALSWTIYSDVDNTVILNLTGCTATFYLKRHYNDPTPILTAAGVIDDPTSGEIKLTITHTQSANYNGNYVYELKLTDTLGLITTVTTGYIIFAESTTVASGECLYCSPDDVSMLIRLEDCNGNRLKFSATSSPSLSEVTDLIRMSMAHIEQFTKDSWREQQVIDYYYSIPNPYHSVYPRYVTIPLKHRNIVKLDKLEVFQGGDSPTYRDWVVDKKEGRGNDYYVDKVKGLVYMKWVYPWFVGQNALRISYTHGNGVTYDEDLGYDYNIPQDIRDACAKDVAIRLMETDFGRAVMVQGMSYDPSRSRVVDYWRKDVDMILRRRTVWTTVGTL